MSSESFYSTQHSQATMNLSSLDPSITLSHLSVSLTSLPSPDRKLHGLPLIHVPSTLWTQETVAE